MVVPAPAKGPMKKPTGKAAGKTRHQAQAAPPAKPIPTPPKPPSPSGRGAEPDGDGQRLIAPHPDLAPGGRWGPRSTVPLAAKRPTARAAAGSPAESAAGGRNGGPAAAAGPTAGTCGDGRRGDGCPPPDRGLRDFRPGSANGGRRQRSICPADVDDTGQGRAANRSSTGRRAGRRRGR